MVVFVASPKKIAFFKQVSDTHHSHILSSSSILFNHIFLLLLSKIVNKIDNGKENDHLPKYVFVNREKTDSEKKFLKEAIDYLKKSNSVYS